MKIPLRVRLKRPWWRVQHAARMVICRHDFESHDSKDDPGTTVYLCRCGRGWKVT